MNSTELIAAARRKWLSDTSELLTPDSVISALLDVLARQIETTELRAALAAIGRRAVPMTAKDEYRRGYKDALDAVRPITEKALEVEPEQALHGNVVKALAAIEEALTR